MSHEFAHTRWALEMWNNKKAAAAATSELLANDNDYTTKIAGLLHKIVLGGEMIFLKFSCENERKRVYLHEKWELKFLSLLVELPPSAHRIGVRVSRNDGSTFKGKSTMSFREQF